MGVFGPSLLIESTDSMIVNLSSTRVFQRMVLCIDIGVLPLAYT
jgi:hypothetical protein